MQTLKQKGRPPSARLHGPRANAHLAISAQEYAFMASFSADAGKIRVKMTDLGKGPFGVGALLKMSSAGGHECELHVDGTGHTLLGKVNDDGQRTRLCEASSNTEAGWERLLAAMRNSEGRLM